VTRTAAEVRASLAQRIPVRGVSAWLVRIRAMKRSAPEVFQIMVIMGLVGVILTILLVTLVLWIGPAK
jgi:hypothetical protein